MTITVIDSNLAVALVVPLPYSEVAGQRFRAWKEAGVDLCAPTLWGYEVASTLRQMTVAKVISPREALDGFHSILVLTVQEISPTPELHQEALRWADQLGQRVAYDAAYLALAEQLQAHFWTADRRLANAAQQAGATWVHWIGGDYPQDP